MSLVTAGWEEDWVRRESSVMLVDSAVEVVVVGGVDSEAALSCVTESMMVVGEKGEGMKESGVFAFSSIRTGPPVCCNG